jgi:hypothetical protein
VTTGTPIKSEDSTPENEKLNTQINNEAALILPN